MTTPKAPTRVEGKPIPDAPLEPGVYFGLDEETYHRDSALGSTDMRNLRLSAPDYWWGSSLNPDREDDENDDTPAKVRGAAMHKLVLEGEGAFDAIYRRGPTQDSTMTPAQKGAATKDAKAKLPPGCELLPAKDYDRIAIAGAMITKNPALQTAFLGGVSEVSVFWDREHKRKNGKPGVVRCKARFDYLKPRGIGDLKSITNIKKIEFRRACIESIANYRYDMQAVHYLDGRAQLPLLVADGAVYGAHDPDLLKRVAAAQEYAFQFVFFQASKAPVTFSKVVTPDPANPFMQLGEMHLDEAAENYLDYMDAFGPDQVWLMLDKPSELAMEDMPGWFAR